VRQALELILPPLGLDYAADGSFLRVFRREPETRLFDINYVVVTRTGTTGVGTPAGTPGSSARLETITTADLFSEIGKSVQTLLSERATFSVDRKAGLLQVTDFPERLDRVALYLDAVHDRVHRQVQIDARVLEVTVDDPEAPALDVAALIRGDQPTGSVARPMVSGLGPADVTRFLAALTARGKVSVLATPRVLVLNNEPALVRAASRPADGSASGGVGDHEEFTLGVTPQITTDGVIMLSLTPIVTVHTNADTTNPRPTLVRETDTIARIADGESIIVAGFTREQVTRERKNAGVKGGWFGRSTVVTRKRVELLVLLTPRIVAPVGTQ
jgi:type II secretory pathway component GspD/PulD (secretin)